MKFKTEVGLLALSIALFVLSSYYYSYQPDASAVTLSLASYPYQMYALSFVGFGSILMVTASISYSKRSKNLIQ